MKIPRHTVSTRSVPSLLRRYAKRAVVRLYINKALRLYTINKAFRLYILVFVAVGNLAISLSIAAQPANPLDVPDRPTRLRPDIEIEYFAEAAPKSVRIARDPVSGNLHYVTFDGEVFEIRSEDGEPSSVRIATADDHGIIRLQGMVFFDSTLYLAGNVPVNNAKGTKGRLVRGTLDDDGSRSWATVFMTEEIGSTKTTFDHGFNGLTVSPDGAYLYVNSGARTDHGEIQDNDGTYPGARDEPLTAAVLRIPTSSHDLLLPNDLDELTENGYLLRAESGTASISRSLRAATSFSYRIPAIMIIRRICSGCGKATTTAFHG